MTVLLLGGTGYLGENLARAFAAKGWRIICVVRNTSNLVNLKGICGIEFVSNELGQLEITLKNNRIDWIVNGVCSYLTNDSLYGDMLQSNVIFPLSVLNLSIKHNTPGFITAGTALPENLNVYSFTKHKFSDFGRFLSEKDGIVFLDLKLEMFYGGYSEPNNRFMSSCRSKLFCGEPVELTSGRQKRDIIRVEDVVGIVSRLVETDCFQGYNSLAVGTGESHSIKDIVEYMKKEMNSDSELKYYAVQERKGEPDTLADVAWYKELGYELIYSYYDGIKDYCYNAVRN